jgi:hypothetical protein
MRSFHFIPLVLAVATATLAPAAFVPQLERFAEKSPVQASDSPGINVYSSTSDDFKKLVSNPDELKTKMTALNKKIAEEDKARVATLRTTITSSRGMNEADIKLMGSLSDDLNKDLNAVKASQAEDAKAKVEAEAIAKRATNNINKLKNALIAKCELTKSQSATFHQTYDDAKNMLTDLNALTQTVTTTEISFWSMKTEVETIAATVMSLLGELEIQKNGLSGTVTDLKAKDAALATQVDKFNAAGKGYDAAKAGADAAAASKTTAQNKLDDSTAKNADATSANADAIANNDASAARNTAATTKFNTAKSTNKIAVDAKDAAAVIKKHAEDNAVADKADLDAKLALLNDANAKKEKQLFILKKSIADRLKAVEAAVALKEQQMAAVQNLQAQVVATFEAMKVKINAAEDILGRMQAMGTLSIFAPPVKEGGDDCKKTHESGLKAPTGYCIKEGGDVKNNEVFKKIADPAILTVRNAWRKGEWWAGFSTPRRSSMALWDNLKMNDGKCGDPSFADRAVCGLYDVFYEKEIPSMSSQNMAFRVTGECVSPYFSMQAAIQGGGRGGSAVDGRIERLGMTTEDMSAMEANLKKILGGKQDSPLQFGGYVANYNSDGSLASPSADQVKGTCYDQDMMNQITKSIKSIYEVGNNLDNGDGLKDAAAAADAATTAAKRFRFALQPDKQATATKKFSANADGVTAAKVKAQVCKDASDLADLIGKAEDRTAAMSIYLTNVAGIYAQIQGVKTELTTRLGLFEAKITELKTKRTKLNDNLRAAGQMEEDIRKDLQLTKDQIADIVGQTDKRKQGTDTLNAWAAHFNQNAAADRTAAAGLTDAAGALDTQTDGLKADTAAKDAGTAANDADSATKDAGAAAADASTADANAAAAAAGVATDAAKASSATSIAAAGVAVTDTATAEERIKQAILDIARSDAALALVKETSSALTAAVALASEDLGWARDDFEGYAQKFTTEFEVLSFCDRLECYDECKSAPVNTPILDKCSAEKAKKDLAQVLGVPVADPDTPNVVQFPGFPIVPFRLNAFGLDSDKPSIYNPKGKSNKKCNAAGEDLYACIAPAGVDALELDTKKFAEILNKLSLQDKPPIEIEITGFFARGRVETPTDDMKTKSKGRAERYKYMLIETAKAIGVTNGQGSGSFDFICTKASDTTSVNPKSLGRVAEKGLCSPAA